jgi:hypothetical protein
MLPGYMVVFRGKNSIISTTKGMLINSTGITVCQYYFLLNLLKIFIPPIGIVTTNALRPVAPRSKTIAFELLI